MCLSLGGKSDTFKIVWYKEVQNSNFQLGLINFFVLRYLTPLLAPFFCATIQYGQSKDTDFQDSSINYISQPEVCMLQGIFR